MLRSSDLDDSDSSELSEADASSEHKSQQCSSLTDDLYAFPEALLSALRDGATSSIQDLMNTCDCTKLGSAKKIVPCGGWDLRSLPLEVYLSFYTKDRGLMEFLTKASIARFNLLIGAEVFVYVDQPTKAFPKGRKAPHVSVRISMDHRHGRGHAITRWEPKWDSVHRNKLDKMITVPLLMRPKDDLPLRKRAFAYYSTLTHELCHCLGMAHFPELEMYRAEIIFPKAGAAPMPIVPPELEHVAPSTPEELPPWKSSPRAIRALRWYYANPFQTSAKLKGMPVYCDTCKELGWLCE